MLQHGHDDPVAEVLLCEDITQLSRVGAAPLLLPLVLLKARLAD